MFFFEHFQAAPQESQPTSLLATTNDDGKGKEGGLDVFERSHENLARKDLPDQGKRSD
jgi:hypothetical protein